MPVKLSFIEAGYTPHSKAVAVQGASWAPIRFPASVAVLEHRKEGVILFDTGYSPRFHEQTRHFPEKLYALTTHVVIRPEWTALAQLREKGIRAKDVRNIILSHFHADHIGGVADFSSARYIYSGAGYDHVSRLSRFASVRAGFLRGLLPGDFEARSRRLGYSEFVDGPGNHSGYLPGFSQGLDLFGDGSVVVVDLPGHAEGHLGLIVHAEDSQTYFLVSDACWHRESYQLNRPPHPVANLIFADARAYRATLGRIHHVAQASPAVRIVPCHCSETLQTLPRLEHAQAD